MSKLDILIYSKEKYHEITYHPETLKQGTDTHIYKSPDRRFLLLLLNNNNFLLAEFFTDPYPPRLPQNKHRNTLLLLPLISTGNKIIHLAPLQKFNKRFLALPSPYSTTKYLHILLCRIPAHTSFLGEPRGVN